VTLADETPTAALSLLGRLISIAVSEQVDHSVEVFLRRERMPSWSLRAGSYRHRRRRGAALAVGRQPVAAARLILSVTPSIPATTGCTGDQRSTLSGITNGRASSEGGTARLLR
jgi:hypothetical protein